jgi:hypothetical protein
MSLLLLFLGLCLALDTTLYVGWALIDVARRDVAMSAGRTGRTT